MLKHLKRIGRGMVLLMCVVAGLASLVGLLALAVKFHVVAILLGSALLLGIAYVFGYGLEDPFQD